jgi:hypothetical protein
MVSFCPMSAAEIIQALKELPAEQRAEVLRAAQVDGPELTRRLTPEEIGQLADKLIAAKSEEEAGRIKRVMVNGFYGAVIDAQNPADRFASRLVSAPDRSCSGARDNCGAISPDISS